MTTQANKTQSKPNDSRLDGLSLSECYISMQIAEHRASIASLEAERNGEDPDDASLPYCEEKWMYEEQAHKLIPVSADDFLAAIALLHKSLVVEGERAIETHKQLMENIRKGIHISFGTPLGKSLANSHGLMVPAENGTYKAPL